MKKAKPKFKVGQKVMLQLGDDGEFLVTISHSIDPTCDDCFVVTRELVVHCNSLRPLTARERGSGITHEWNSKLVSEHYELRREIASLEAKLQPSPCGVNELAAKVYDTALAHYKNAAPYASREVGITEIADILREAIGEGR